MIELEAVRESTYLFSVGNGDGVTIDVSTMSVTRRAPLGSLIASGGWSVPSAHPDEIDILCEVVTASLAAMRAAERMEHTTSNSFRVPKSVRAQIQRGIAEDGDVPHVSLTMTTHETVTREDMRNLLSYFASHPDGDEDKRMWSLHGGHPGKKWVEGIFAVEADTPAASLPNPNEDLRSFGPDFDPPEEFNPNGPDPINPDKPHVFDLNETDGDCILCTRTEDDPIHVPSREAQEAAILGYEGMTLSSRRDGYAKSSYDVPLIWQFTTFATHGDVEPETITYCVDIIDHDDETASFYIRNLYVRDDDTGDLYLFSPVSRQWVPARPVDRELYELEDDDASRALERILAGEKEFTLDFDEQALVDAITDWSFIDEALELAAYDDESAPAPPQPVNDGYTPEERSGNATKQLRDERGRFASIGGRVLLPDGKHGVIIAHRGDNIIAETDDGGTEEVPAKEARVEVGVARIEGDVEIVDDIGELIRLYLEDPSRVDELASQPPPTPDGVKPLYLAFVDKDDPNLVLNFVALVPPAEQGGEPVVYERREGQWIADEKHLRALRSATPPPTVKLNDEQVEMVYAQAEMVHKVQTEEKANGAPAETSEWEFDWASPLYGPHGEVLSLVPVPNVVAAGVPGIADTPSDVRNARRLKKYWLYGPGAAKIKWGLRSGAWRRCVRYLSKHMGPRSRGYCANLFHERLGVWPSSKENRGRK